LAQIINRRWNLGLGFVSGDGVTVTAPQQNEHATVRATCQLIQGTAAGMTCCEATGADAARSLAAAARGNSARAFEYPCQAGLREVAVPIVVEGAYMGTVLAGGFLAAETSPVDAPAVVPRVSSLHLSTGELLGALERHPRLLAKDVEYLTELM